MHCCIDTDIIAFFSRVRGLMFSLWESSLAQDYRGDESSRARALKVRLNSLVFFNFNWSWREEDFQKGLMRLLSRSRTMLLEF